MTQAEGRIAVAQESLTWVRTPFAYGQCVKGPKGGVDCGRFPAAVFNAAGVKDIDMASLPHLPPQWFMHRSDESYLDQLRRFCVEYDLSQKTPEPGDIVVAEYGRDWAHTAIVLEWPKVIAAAHEFVVTVWNNIYLSPQYSRRRLKFFDPWAPGAGGNRA